MKRYFILVTVVSLTLILAFSFAIPAVAKDDGSLPLTGGFSIDQGDHKIPRGSVIHHLGNGITEVYGPDNSLVTRVKDSESNRVNTPSGLVNAAYVFNVPSGSEIERHGNETDIYENGIVILKVIDTKIMTVPQYNGWVESAYNWSAGNLTYFGANWVVPSNPPNPGVNVVDFLFNAIEPYSGTEIIQPVLEWNQAGSHGWTLRSWFGPVNGSYYCSSPVTARVNDSLSGVLSHSYSGWSIVTRDVSTNRSTSIGTRSVGTSNLAVFCALEGYNISTNSDVPGTTAFSNMSFQYNRRNLNMTWQPFIAGGTGLTGLKVETISSSQVKLDTANK